MLDFSEVKIKRSRRSSISLHIQRDGSLEVRAPYLIPQGFIKKFVENHADWIEKKRALVKKAIKPVKKLTNGEKIVYLGKEYELLFGNYTKIEAVGSSLQFPLGMSFRAKETLEKWYISQAKKIITEQVQYYSTKMETSFVSITYSDTRSKWGSCTGDNRLQFNWRLIMTPLLVLRYVVIHELAHTKEKNHSAAFWRIVRESNPSYKLQIKWLKENGNGLTI